MQKSPMQSWGVDPQQVDGFVKKRLTKYIQRSEELEQNNSPLSFKDNPSVFDAPINSVKAVITKELEPLVKALPELNSRAITPKALYSTLNKGQKKWTADFYEKNHLPRATKYVIEELYYSNLMLDKVYEDIVDFSSKLGYVFYKRSNSEPQYFDRVFYFKFILNFLMHEEKYELEFPICFYENLFVGFDCPMTVENMEETITLAGKHHREILDIFKPYEQDFPKLKELREFLMSTSLKVNKLWEYSQPSLIYKKELDPKLDEVNIYALANIYASVVKRVASSRLDLSESLKKGVHCFACVAIMLFHMISCLTAQKSYFLSLYKVSQMMTKLRVDLVVFPNYEIFFNFKFPEEESYIDNHRRLIKSCSEILKDDQLERLNSVPTEHQALFDALGVTKLRSFETKETLAELLKVELKSYKDILPDLSLNEELNEYDFEKVDEEEYEIHEHFGTEGAIEFYEITDGHYLE